MDSGTVIIDISSDEENCKDDSFDMSDEWINELLGCVDIDVQEDFDDVMVLDELSAPSCMKKSSPVEKDSVDDCLVLDGDPDKLIHVVDGKHNSMDELDDLVIVGEKGHLACRDYPHSRHLCVSFPFNSTPHENHCKLCHCYACDSPAPCKYWGIGTLATDHCHSNENESRWKALRSNFKLGITTASGPLRLPRSNQSHSQPFQCSQDIYNPIPVSQNARQPSTRRSATAVPDPSIRRKRQMLGSSISDLRIKTVNQGTLHHTKTQSYHNSCASVRAMFARPYFGSRVNGRLGSSSQGLSVSKQPQKSDAQGLHYTSVMQGSYTKPLASPHVNDQSIQPEATNDMNRLRGILASIEADLLGTDYNSESIA